MSLDLQVLQAHGGREADTRHDCYISTPCTITSLDHIEKLLGGVECGFVKYVCHCIDGFKIFWITSRVLALVEVSQGTVCYKWTLKVPES